MYIKLYCSYFNICTITMSFHLKKDVFGEIFLFIVKQRAAGLRYKV